MGFLDRVGRFIDDVILLPDDVRATMERAETALAARDWDEAEEAFLLVLASRASLPRAWVGLAQARAGDGDVRGALEAIEQARELARDDGDVALIAAELALAAGENAAAAEHARQAVQHLAATGGRALADACAIRARAEWRRGRPDRAVRELRKVVSLVPNEPAFRIELVEALADAGHETEARGAAAALELPTAEPGVANRIGQALRRLRALDAARPWLDRAAAGGHPEAHAALARMALARDEIDDAERHARQAISRGGGPDALVALGEVAAAAGRRDEASEAFAAAAAARGDDPELLRAAVRAAPAADRRLLLRTADALERVAPGDPAARAARAELCLADHPEEARRLATEAGDEPRAALVLARLALHDGRAQDAIAAVDALAAGAARSPWAALDAAEGEQVRRDALRRLWRGGDGDVDLAAAIDAAARFGAERALPDVERGAARLRDELDRPLLLAVLGEFNAGKSTLINAFIGAEVAPMGILPTTASLNILRGGAERRVRVVRADGTTREGGYDELRALLAEARDGKDAGGEAIDHVEIVLPSEPLERVWILDTPGTNALDPEHERLALLAARRADAVLWIFDVGQAGKKTEGAVLAGIRRSGRLVVPVLNKKDRFEPEEIATVQALLREELPTIEVSAIPISARQALAGRVAGDDGAVDESGFTALLGHLEQHVFSRSRELKRAACAARLLEVLDAALATEPVAAAGIEEQAARLEAGQAALAQLAAAIEQAVDEAVRLLDTAQTRAFAEAAEEVLAFVRPRENRFARHGADPEDRAFLAEVLERRLGEAIESGQTRLVARVRGLLAPPAEQLGFGSGIDDRVRAALAPPVAAFWGFQRGVLQGGTLLRFFEDVLPRAELEPKALADALAASRADPREELRPPLSAAAARLVGALEGERQSALARARQERARLSGRTYGPLRALREVLAELL